MTIAVLTIRLHEKAHRLGDEYYQAMSTWIRAHRDRKGEEEIHEHLVALKTAADAYLYALTVFREHLGTLQSTDTVTKQVELTETFIELVGRNKGVYERAGLPDRDHLEVNVRQSLNDRQQAEAKR